MFLVEDHPAHKYVKEVMMRGLKGHFKPVILDVLPIRAYWLMTTKWNIEKEEGANAVSSFVKKYSQPVYVGMTRKSIEHAFELSKELGHDVYDCCYLALAMQEGAAGIITTDTDFESLCKKKHLMYENPVPKKVLMEFKR